VFNNVEKQNKAFLMNYEFDVNAKERPLSGDGK
jgi:hypothetical protein